MLDRNCANLSLLEIITMQTDDDPILIAHYCIREDYFRKAYIFCILYSFEPRCIGFSQICGMMYKKMQISRQAYWTLSFLSDAIGLLL